MEVRRLTPEDLPRLCRFWMGHWGDEIMITRGNIYRPEQLEGFVIEDGECEVTSLDSLREGQGIGSKLIDVAIDEARKQNCKRFFLITTNDNMNALRFYQKRRFELVALYCGAVNESRKIKPSIPLTGFDDIPLRDEIELEIRL